MTESFKPIDGTTAPISVKKTPKIIKKTPKIINIVEDFQLEEKLSRQFRIDESTFNSIVSAMWKKIDKEEKKILLINV